MKKKLVVLLLLALTSAVIGQLRKPGIGGSGGGSSSSGNTTATGTYASIPAAGTSGNVYLPSNGFSLYRDSGSAWVPWGPLFPLVDPNLVSWTAVNSPTVSTTRGGIFIQAPANAGDNVRMYVTSVPSAPYTRTLVMLPLMVTENYHACGMVLRESSSGKFVTLGINQDGKLQISKWTNATTFSADYLAFPGNVGVVGINGIVALQLSDNSTNRISRVGRDGQNVIDMHTVGRTDFITPDQIGFFVNSNNASHSAQMTVLSWQ